MRDLTLLSTPRLTAFLKCSSNFLSVCHHFWSCHPALFYSLAALLGVFSTSTTPYLFILFGMTLIICCFPAACKKGVIFILIALAFYTYGTKVSPSSFAFPQKSVAGEGFLDIKTVSRGEKYHRLYWKYKAFLRTFSDSQGVAYDVQHQPLHFTLPYRTERLLGNGSYHFQGILTKTEKGSLRFKPSEINTWTLLKKNWNLGELRFLVKDQVTHYIRNSFSNEQVSAFITGLATGDFHDPEMIQELSRFGLQHIMAISGFHFAILTAILASLLRFFLSRRQVILLLLFFLSGYFLLIGLRPSIFRAWVGISLYLVSSLLHRQSSPLNNLGCALLLLLVIDPLSAFNSGCQLSFLATAAILFFYTPCHNMICSFLKARHLSNASKMDRLNQHGYVLLSFFRSGLALALAVNAVLFPCLLYLFHQFSLLGLLYNLFFPFAVSIIILFLIVGTCLHFIFPPLGILLHNLNQMVTKILLAIVYNIPTTFDRTVDFTPPSISALCLFLMVILHLGIYLYRQQEREWVI